MLINIPKNPTLFRTVNLGQEEIALPLTFKLSWFGFFERWLWVGFFAILAALTVGTALLTANSDLTGLIFYLSTMFSIVTSAFLIWATLAVARAWRLNTNIFIRPSVVVSRTGLLDLSIADSEIPWGHIKQFSLNNSLNLAGGTLFIENDAVSDRIFAPLKLLQSPDLRKLKMATFMFARMSDRDEKLPRIISTIVKSHGGQSF